MNYGEGEFAFRKVFTHPFVGRIFGGGDILVVVTDLEDYAHEIDEGYTVPGYMLVMERMRDGVAYLGVLLSACINFIANLNRPPVLLPTISR